MTRTRRPVRRAGGRGTSGRRVPGALAVQLLPHLLAAGELPAAQLGDVLDVTPAIYAGIVHTHPTVFHGSHAPDHFAVDEFGCLDARGAVTTVALDPTGECSCRIEVLDAAGRLVPVNWAATEPPEDDGPVHLEGSLYLDPMLEAGSEHGDAVALCRRPFRVAALRRYRRMRDRPLGPVALSRVPVPAEVSDDELYVVDLVAQEDVSEVSGPGPLDGVEA